MDNPFITIIVVTFNSRFFIKKCLHSVFSQKLDNSEVVIVDNDSSDGTESFIRENYPKVILIKNSENKGISFARNQEIKIKIREHNTYSVFSCVPSFSSLDFS